MFVYLKEPMGSSVICGYNVYGKYYSRGAFGPANIPRNVYFKHRHVLEEFVITGEWLERRFGRPFPSLSFIPSDMWMLDFYTTIELARALGIDYKTRGNKEYTDIEKRALRRSVLGKIEGRDESD